METSLAKSISHSLKFIPSLINIYEDFLKKALDTVDTLSDLDEEDEKYKEKVRSGTDKFIEETDKKLEKFKMDHQLLQNDFDTIIKEKHNEDVIYELRNYLDLYKKIKKIHKKLGEVTNDIKLVLNESLYADNYVLHANFHKITKQVLIYDEILKRDMKRMETLLSIENDDKK